MADLNTRKVVDRYGQAMERLDLESLETILHDDFIEDYPQSGERIHGRANLFAILSNYPGGEPQTIAVDAIVGAEDRWVVTPSYQPMRVEGAGDQYTAVAHITYPDGSDWHAIQFIRLKDGRIHRITSYYAPAFEAPDWRAPYVERVAPG